MLLLFSQIDKAILLSFVVIIFILAQALIVYLISLFILKSSLSRFPNQPDPSTPAQSMAVDVQRFIRTEYPGAVWFGEQAQNFEHWFMPSFDGLKLHAWYLPALNSGLGSGGEHSQKTAIVCHGYSDHMGSIALYTRYFHTRGFNVLMIDQRCHGYSEGKYIGMSVSECQDLQDWTREVYTKTPEVKDIVWVGWSMGAATVLELANVKMDKVKLIIADSGYTSVQNAVLAGSQSAFQRGVMRLFMPLVNFYIKRRTGTDLRRGHPLWHVERAVYPILYFHGDKDLRVPFHMGEELYAATITEKEFVVAPGSAHVRGFAEHCDLYENAMDQFLTKHIA